MGVGAGAGLGITGYYEGKKMRNESESKDAAMRIQELEDELREERQANEMAKIPEQAARDRHTADQEARRRSGELVRADHELPRAIREEESAVRKNDIDAAGHAGAREAAENSLAIEQRREAIDSRNHKGDLVTADDSVGKAKRGIKTEEEKALGDTQRRTQDTVRFKTKEIYDSVPGALRDFEASNYDGAVFDRWYDKYLPNGHNVDTRPDPNVKGGYITTDSDGNEKPVGSAKELMEGFQKAFRNMETLAQMNGDGALGKEPGMDGPGNRGRGINGYGGRGTQLERMYPQVVEDLHQQYPDMPEWELRLEAIKFLKERGGEPDDVFRRKWTADTMEVILGMSDIGDKKQKAMEEFWEMSKMLFGKAGAKPKPEGGDDPLSDKAAVDEIYNGVD